VYGEQADHGMQYAVMTIVPNRAGDNFEASHIMLDIAQDPFMVNAYRIALIVSLEDFFGRVQVFGDGHTGFSPPAPREQKWDSDKRPADLYTLYSSPVCKLGPARMPARFSRCDNPNHKVLVAVIVMIVEAGNFRFSAIIAMAEIKPSRSITISQVVFLMSVGRAAEHARRSGKDRQLCARAQ
jgi:hypothetical protein